MKITTWNVNGIRAATKKGVFDWINDNNADVVCLQEIKAKNDQIDLGPIHDAGYQCICNPAERPGYSGVANLYSKEPEKIKLGFDKGKIPGEILIQFEKSRQNKEWIKTVLIGSDLAIVFAMLKQSISANFNERMAIFVPNPDALDEIWDKNIYQKESIEKTLLRIMRELSKLNPQGQVHAQELYASINVVRRCPPSLVLHQLLHAPTIEYLGDLYFRFKEKDK